MNGFQNLNMLIFLDKKNAKRCYVMGLVYDLVLVKIKYCKDKNTG